MFQKIKNLFAKIPKKALFISLAILLFTPTRFAWAEDTGLSGWAQFFNFFTLAGLTELGFKILYAVTTFILGSIVIVAKWLFDLALSLSMKKELYEIAQAGWSVSLALANNLFILILLAIAIATILGLSQFNYKKMLPPFLMVLLLINFSMVIGKVIIDITNLFAFSFSQKILNEADKAATGNVKNQLGASGLVANTLKASGVNKVMENAVAKKANDPLWISNFITSFMAFLYQIFVYLLMIFTYLVGAVYMLTRTFWLLLLLILAPLAWIALLIPSLKKHWTTWWDKFIKWCLFAPAYLFFLMLGLNIGNAIFKEGGVLRKLSENTNLSGIPVINVFGALLVGFVLIMGTFVSGALGVGGSNFVMNYANKMKGAASKKLKDLRSKSPFSAEKLGAKFGKWGAGALAYSRIGGVVGFGRETRERLQQERLEEKKKKENTYKTREELKKFRGGESTEHTNLKKEEQAAKETREQLAGLKEKERAGTLTNAESSAITFLEESAKQHQENIKNLTSKLRDKEIDLLKKIRAGTTPGGPKFSADDIEKFLKAQKEGAAPATS